MYLLYFFKSGNIAVISSFELQNYLCFESMLLYAIKYSKTHRNPSIIYSMCMYRYMTAYIRVVGLISYNCRMYSNAAGFKQMRKLHARFPDIRLSGASVCLQETDIKHSQLRH